MKAKIKHKNAPTITKTSDPFYNLIIIVDVLVLVISIPTSLFLLPSEIPLFFGNLQPADRLASHYFYPLAALLALGFSLINRFLDHQSDLFLSTVCKIASLVVTIFATISLIKIYQLVGYRL